MDHIACCRNLGNGGRKQRGDGVGAAGAESLPCGADGTPDGEDLLLDSTVFLRHTGEAAGWQAHYGQMWMLLLQSTVSPLFTPPSSQALPPLPFFLLILKFSHHFIMVLASGNYCNSFFSFPRSSCFVSLLNVLPIP